MYLFVRYKFGWNEIDYSIYSTFYVITHMFGTSVGSLEKVRVFAFRYSLLADLVHEHFENRRCRSGDTLEYQQDRGVFGVRFRTNSFRLLSGGNHRDFERYQFHSYAIDNLQAGTTGRTGQDQLFVRLVRSHGPHNLRSLVQHRLQAHHQLPAGYLLHRGRRPHRPFALHLRVLSSASATLLNLSVSVGCTKSTNATGKKTPHHTLIVTRAKYSTPINYFRYRSRVFP